MWGERIDGGEDRILVDEESGDWPSAKETIGLVEGQSLVQVEASCVRRGRGHNVVELRVPLDPAYLPVLRGTAGVIAGTQSFTYDEVMQLRVGVAEVFDVALRHVARLDPFARGNEIAFHFIGEPDGLQVIAIYAGDFVAHPDTEEELKSQALLVSLLDEVQYEATTSGGTLVRIKKQKSEAKPQRRTGK